MKKNFRKLDYLIGTLFCNKKYNPEHIGMVVDIEYHPSYKVVVLEWLNGPYPSPLRLVQSEFSAHYKKLE